MPEAASRVVATDLDGTLLARCVGLDAEELYYRVATAVDGVGELAYSGAVGLAEVTAPGVTKAAGATRWCARQGVEADDVWAFGDMPNDLPLLRWAGVSYAVQNAHPDVLAAADHTCAGNDDDGVARVLERLVRERQGRRSTAAPMAPSARSSCGVPSDATHSPSSCAPPSTRPWVTPSATGRGSRRPNGGHRCSAAAEGRGVQTTQYSLPSGSAITTWSR
ncbi:MAG: HAD family hydrolase [Mycobacteriales bacterium]